MTILHTNCICLYIRLREFLPQIPLYCHCDALFRELASRHKTTVMKKLAEALCNTAMKSDGDGGGADAMEAVLSSVTVLYQSGDSKASPGLSLACSWCLNSKKNGPFTAMVSCSAPSFIRLW